MDTRRKDYRKMQMYKNIMNGSYDFNNPDASTMEFIQKVSASALGITDMTDIDSLICIVLDMAEKLINARQAEIARSQANDMMKRGKFIHDKPPPPPKRVPVPNSLLISEPQEYTHTNIPIPTTCDVDELLASLENEMNATSSKYLGIETNPQTSKNVTFHDASNTTNADAGSDDALLEPEDILKEWNGMSLMQHAAPENLDITSHTDKEDSIQQRLEKLRHIVRSMQ